MIADVRFQPNGRLYCFDAQGQDDLQPGDYVLVETVRGQQLGEVVSVRRLADTEDEGGKELKRVQRRATGVDLAQRTVWKVKEAEALDFARQSVTELRLPIRAASAEFTFDGKLLTLQYLASDKQHGGLGKLKGRLRQRYNVRVELRRIGPRDQAKVLGGYGACGEPRCCSRFLTDFEPVSIKMAKTQGVSLSPSEITGMCGRLRCCLAYESQQYEEACKLMPRRKKRVKTPHGVGKVLALLPLKGRVIVQVDDQRIEVPVEEIEPV
jgi:cell fate regulator YaaT (PSP1 superfamily)